jgi:hypothetical protein
MVKLLCCFVPEIHGNDVFGRRSGDSNCRRLPRGMPALAMLHFPLHFDLFCPLERVRMQCLLPDVLLTDLDNEMVVQTEELGFELLGQQKLAVTFSLFHLVVREGFRQIVTVLDPDLVVRAILAERHVRIRLVIRVRYRAKAANKIVGARTAC